LVSSKLFRKKRYVFLGGQMDGDCHFICPDPPREKGNAKGAITMARKSLLNVLLTIVLGTGLASAQASRTWVSGVGDDANPCSRTAPCKTFAGAISKTAAGGEIDALDPAGYGAVTITKAITIDGGGGQVASVLVAGTNGIVVQAGPSDVVILRNLRINGIVGSGNGGINGIRFLSGLDLNVENCYIFGFTTNGIDVALNQGTQASVHVLSSVIKQVNGVGIRATNAVTPAVQVGIDNTAVILTSTGIQAAQHSHVTVNRSVVENASTDGVQANDSATSDAIMTVDHTDLSFNGHAATAATGSSVSVDDSKLAFSGTCAFNNAGGIMGTFQNNRVVGVGNCGATTPLGQQ
jgi:hypothetical protein